MGEAKRRIGARMTYCVGVLLNDGIVLASDSRTHAGVDNFATFCKMTVFERPDDRVIVLLSSGNLAGTQAVISVLKQRGEAQGERCHQRLERSHDVRRRRHRFRCGAGRRAPRRQVSAEHELLRSARRSSSAARSRANRSDCSGRLPRAISSRQVPIPLTSRRVRRSTESLSSIPSLAPSTNLSDAMKCVLVSFDSTMRSNLSVGMPIDLACCERDSSKARHPRTASNTAMLTSAPSASNGAKVSAPCSGDCPLYHCDELRHDYQPMEISK